MKIYLIRHGESTSDIEDRYGGDYDDPLTPKGRKQARDLLAKLLNQNIEIIFSSPKLRALETAKILQAKLNCDLKIINNLRERNYGVLTGMKKKEAEKKYPEQVALLADYRNTIENGETYHHLEKRVSKAFHKIIKSRYNIISIVTHAGPIRCIVREVLQKEFSYLSDCAILELQKEKDNLVLTGIENAELKQK